MKAVLLSSKSEVTLLIRNALKQAGCDLIDLENANLVYDVVENDDSIRLVVFVALKKLDDQASVIRRITEDCPRPIVVVMPMNDAQWHDNFLTAGAQHVIYATGNKWVSQFHDALTTLKAA